MAGSGKNALNTIAADTPLPHIDTVIANEIRSLTASSFGLQRANTQGQEWDAAAIAVVRRAYPDLDFTFSVTTEYEALKQQDVSMLDFLEAHIWMTQWTTFYDDVGYNYERFDPKGYDNLAERGMKTYPFKSGPLEGRASAGRN